MGRTTPAIASRGQNRVVFIFSKRTKLQQQREWTGRREREQRIHRERGGCSTLCRRSIWGGGPGQSCSSKTQFQSLSSELERLGFLSPRLKRKKVKLGRGQMLCCQCAALQCSYTYGRTDYSALAKTLWSQFRFLSLPMSPRPESHVSSVLALFVHSQKQRTESGSGRTLRPSLLGYRPESPDSCGSKPNSQAPRSDCAAVHRF